ncbi:hypothetical protein EF294_10305 [Gordonia oryzae]|uniref:Uncharacterized protein n=1 Tax=Gordonia oryzae TaxID=2487349 RepID=A0A3N4GGW4_9ACTN|nr:hypothetical protein [Gordonia oryzae]RPA61038.1 hypothetical protein EF294_10305 [Gordonia oryzae]
MKAERFLAKAQRSYPDADVAVMGSRLAGTARELYRAAPEVFPRTWNDIGWYSLTRGRGELESLDLGDDEVAALVCRRMMREDPDGPEVDWQPYVRLDSQGLPVFSLTGHVGTYATGSLTLNLQVDSMKYEVIQGDCLTSEQRRVIVRMLAEAWRYDWVLHELVDQSVVVPQVVLPAITDLEGRRRAAGVRWRTLLGWLTYLDESYYPVDPHTRDLPSYVSIDRFRSGVLIQIGERAEDITESMIAATRRAIGLEYIADLL